MQNDLSSFRKDIAKFQSITKEELNVHIPEITRHTSDRITCKYYLISCNFNDIRLDDFIKLLHDKVLNYVLRHDEIQSINHENAMRLTRRARSKFREYKKSGEVGELILYLILESRSITQIIKKMNLKTSHDVNFFGLDGVHMEITDDESIVLHYGESKMVGGFSRAVKDAFDSLDGFYQDINQEGLEIDLILSKIDESKFGKYKEVIENIFDPYSVDKNNLKKVNSVFIGYNETFLKKKSKLSEKIFDFYTRNLNSKVNSSTSKVCKKVKGYPRIMDREFTFYVIPFPNVTDFNERFLDYLRG